MSEKVNVEDIIGLVKTEEQTNSVSLKKEAQLSICEKRLLELEKENEQLKKHREELFYRERDAKNDWRKLKYENEQLKSKLKLILEKKYHKFVDGDIGNFKIEDLELE